MGNGHKKRRQPRNVMRLLTRRGMSGDTIRRAAGRGGGDRSRRADGAAHFASARFF